MRPGESRVFLFCTGPSGRNKPRPGATLDGYPRACGDLGAGVGAAFVGVGSGVAVPDASVGTGVAGFGVGIVVAPGVVELVGNVVVAVDTACGVTGGSARVSLGWRRYSGFLGSRDRRNRFSWRRSLLPAGQEECEAQRGY